MRVFTDFHHASLLNSLILLFEGRLGGEVYRPIGEDWHTEGYWKVYDHPATVTQYLTVNGATPDGTPVLNNSNSESFSPTGNGIKTYLCRDIDSGAWNKAITLEEFKKAKFDIIIASIPQHIIPFTKLRDSYQPQAKVIYQIGNQWNLDSEQARYVKNIMASARVEIPAEINSVIYHQEFSTQTFHPNFKKREKKIYSFINCLHEKPRDWGLFLQLEELMPDWEFRSFGGQCRDGAMTGSEALADKMREAAFIFHCKTDGDGYGHVIHNAALTATPIITRLEDYKGKLAEPLITPLTSIEVDLQTPWAIVHAITTNYNSPANYAQMSEEIYKKFKENVDFDREEAEIGEFLHRLV